ncbi:hypothetical protein WOLCODRAFT_167293 [Wolfiporia cocos MD-104 SS10]|uniref:Eisosome component PIL1-domain-containing protein n=1 Tax=Wolfiporia cocos (strain MD-104) TaxID=742152 RepID=A0A2H3J4B1_WOLCO|nr:hypothetical protein WOLCODRAFT_167293 [Wolfiporia cocos MD-104 SS10]
MFKTAAKKIAHNSTIPVLGGNKDLRALQDLIIAEKAVLNSLQKLSADIGKASEALRIWGAGEGEDLADVLAIACALYLHYAEGLTNFANHEVSIREHMKSVRTREERLDSLKRRRKSLASDADSAEKKLSKMNPDNKNLRAQTDHLEKLRDEIRILDTDIMTEDASLGDYKRTSCKAWLGMKFGGLSECSEKGVIIGEYGKLIIAEIPMDVTEPGIGRAVYQGHSRTDALLNEARRALYEVMYSSEPRQATAAQPPLRMTYSPELFPVPSSQQRQSTLSQFSPMGDGSRRASVSTSISMPVPASMQIPSMDDKSADRSSRSSQILRSPIAPYAPFPQPQASYTQSHAPSLSYEQLQSAPQPTNELSEFGVVADPYSQRPSSMRSPDERIAGPRSSRYSTFPLKANVPRGPRDSQQYASPPGDRPPSLDVEQPQDSFSSSIAEALGVNFELGRTPQGENAPPAPATSTADRKRMSAESDQRNRSYTPPPPRYSEMSGLPQFDFAENVAQVEEPQLAYTISQECDSRSAVNGDRTDDRTTHESASSPAPEAPESIKESSQEVPLDQDAIQREVSNMTSTDESSLPYPGEEPGRQILERPTVLSPPLREPSPLDERSLNAAAAREVSRELDALMFNTPMANRAPSPLVPPQAPFAQSQRMSPRPSVEVPISQSSPRMIPQYVRERHRSMASPSSISSVSNGDNGSLSQSPTSQRLSEDRGPSPPLPSISYSRGSASPSPSAISSSTPYRTPPEHASPSTSQPNSSVYQLPPGMTTSKASFSTANSGKISAAAFRRQQQMRSPTLPPTPMQENGGTQGQGLSDTSPLVVRKRPLPQSPTSTPIRPTLGMRPPSMPLIGNALEQGVPTESRYRSSSVVHSRDGASNRFSQSSGRSPTRRDDAVVSEDDYEVISAYPSGNEGVGPADDDRSGRMSGYGQGRFATNLEEDGLR